MKLETGHSHRGDGMRHASWIRGLLAAFVAASLGIGCSTAPEKSTDPTVETPAPAPAPEADKSTPPAPQDPGKIDAQDENWRKIAEEAAKSRTVDQQAKVAESGAHYDRALQFQKSGD